MRAHGARRARAARRWRAVPDRHDVEPDRVAVAFARGPARRRARRAGRRHGRRSREALAVRRRRATATACTGPAGRRSCAGPRTSPRTTARSPRSRRAWPTLSMRADAAASRRSCSRSTPTATTSADADADDDRRTTCRCSPVRWSPAEVLRHRDFAAYTPAEFAEARRLMADLRLAGALRRSRRRRPQSRRAARPTCAAPCGAALRAGGEPVDRAFLEPATAAAPARAAARRERLDGAVRPRLRALPARRGRRPGAGSRRSRSAPGSPASPASSSSRDPDAAIARGGAAGRRLVGRHPARRRAARVQRRWGVRGHGRGAVVVILSDGWDRGDPERARRADGPPAPGRPPDRLGEPAQGVARATRRWPGAWRRRCRTSTSSSRATRWRRSRRSSSDGDRRSAVTPAIEGGAAMKEVLDDIERWRAAGHRVAVARVVGIEGSGPRDPGAAMAVNDDGEVAGSVSGGCVEGAVVDRGARGPRRANASRASSRSATPTTRRSRSASRAAARSTCSSSRSTGSARRDGRCAGLRGAARRAAGRARRSRWPR